MNNENPKRFNVRSVTKRLRSLGYDVELVRGDGYFWFHGPDDPLDDHSISNTQSVYVSNLHAFSIEQWVEQFLELKKGADGTIKKGSLPIQSKETSK